MEAITVAIETVSPKAIDAEKSIEISAGVEYPKVGEVVALAEVYYFQPALSNPGMEVIKSASELSPVLRARLIVHV